MGYETEARLTPSDPILARADFYTRQPSPPLLLALFEIGAQAYRLERSKRPFLTAALKLYGNPGRTFLHLVLTLKAQADLPAVTLGRLARWYGADPFDLATRCLKACAVATFDQTSVALTEPDLDTAGVHLVSMGLLLGAYVTWIVEVGPRDLEQKGLAGHLIQAALYGTQDAWERVLPWLQKVGALALDPTGMNWSLDQGEPAWLRKEAAGIEALAGALDELIGKHQERAHLGSDPVSRALARLLAIHSQEAGTLVNAIKGDLCNRAKRAAVDAEHLDHSIEILSDVPDFESETSRRPHVIPQDPASKEPLKRLEREDTARLRAKHPRDFALVSAVEDLRSKGVTLRAACEQAGCTLYAYYQALDYLRKSAKRPF